MAREIRALGGTVTPVCASDYDISSQIGLALRSAAWSFSHMAIPNNWIGAVFSKEHWKTEHDPLHIPFRPVFSLITLADNETRLDGEESSTPEKRARQKGDVVVHITARRLPRNGCKIVGLITQGVPRKFNRASVTSLD